MHHIFFIRSSLDGRLSCFHVLATVHSAAVNFGMHVSCRSYFSLDICPGVGFQSHMIALFLVILRNLHTSPIKHHHQTYTVPVRLDYKLRLN